LKGKGMRMALRVNDVAISEAKIQDEMTRLRSGYEDYVRANGGEPSEAQLREWAEEDVIEKCLFQQAAIATQPVPSDERAQQLLEAHAELFEGIPDEERLSHGKELLQQRRLMREIRKGVKQPSEAELQAYYDSNSEMFMMPEMLRLSHICRFVDSGNKAQAFLELLRIKADVEHFKINWVEAVEANSDSFQRDQGLFTPVSQGDLPAEIEAPLFALKQGEVSDVLELEGQRQSLHLFRLLAREAPQKVAFAEAREHLEKALFEQACQDAVHTKYDELKASAVIQREA